MVLKQGVHGSILSRFLTLEEDFIKVHGTKYNYNLTLYQGLMKNIIIICSQHGPFVQLPHSHLKGSGCQKCGITRTKLTTTYSTKKFITLGNKRHNNKYLYNKTNYVNSTTPVIITCRKHGDFVRTPNVHLYPTSGDGGCQECNKDGNKGRYFNKPTTLYLIELSGLGLYKIGITTKTVTQRYQKDKILWNLVWEVTFPTGKLAHTAEQTLRKKYQEFRYTGANILSTGNTEIYSIKIDKENYD